MASKDTPIETEMGITIGKQQTRRAFSCAIVESIDSAPQPFPSSYRITSLKSQYAFGSKEVALCFHIDDYLADRAFPDHLP